MKPKNQSTSSIPFIVLFLLCACSTPATETEVTPQPAVPATAPPVVKPTPTITEPADIIFYNGILVTMDEDQPAAQALAVRAGLILAVGSDVQVLTLQGSETTLVDLQGRTLMPGLIDGHTHLLTFPDRMGKTLEDAQQVALSHGFTSVSEMWANEDVVNSFLEAEQQDRMRLRVNLFPSYNDGILANDRGRILMQTWYPAHDPILNPASMVRIPGIKIFVDGDNARYERGCWAMTDPFQPEAGVLNRGVCGTPSGDLYWKQDDLNQVVRAAQEAGYRVAFHAMGDRAIETALNAIEFALGGQSNQSYRHQIDHNSMIRPDLLQRYQALDVAATVRGHIELCNLADFEPAFGSERKDWYVNRFELANLGTHAFLETDFGWLIDPDNRFDQRTLDPFMHLYGLVTHRYDSSENETCTPDPIAAARVISVERALEMVTTEPAWAVSMEDYIGSLKVGKYADLIVITGNPLSIDPTMLRDLSVLMTMVGGDIEFCANGHEDLCPTEQEKVAAALDLPSSGNLALNQSVHASNSMQNPPELAVDGDEETYWGAGDFSPQWIEVDLGATASISEIRLLIGQSPNGETTHKIMVRGETGEFTEATIFNQNTSDREWLVFQPNTPLEGLRFVRIETTLSPSWISWIEVQVIGTH